MRPHLKEFLIFASLNFELILFSCSHKKYVEQILKTIDPQKKYFQHVLSKSSSIKHNNFHIKDIRVLDRSPKSTLLVDDMSIAFGENISNAVLITPFLNNKKDIELLMLKEYLQYVLLFEDVREANIPFFKLHNYSKSKDLRILYKSLFKQLVDLQMFETLLEKILGRIVGEYVEGISKDQMKVGIFNGNVEIKDLRIKRSVISQLNVPFELKFGMIEHIKMKIPWTSLQSSPVEAFLKGLYILVVPKDKSAWHLVQQDLVKNKHNFLQKYAQALKDTIAERIKMQQSSQGQEQGYFGKLVQKIIDNLQVEVQDIHIRVESPKQPIENCALGVSLDQFRMFTCDEKWNPSFVDSTSNDTVFKKLDIQNFYVYFNADERNFLTQQCKTNQEYFEAMKLLIYNDQNKDRDDIQAQQYLLNFSTVGKLIQKKLSKQLVSDQIPQFDIQISLNECKLNIQQAQIRKLQGIANLGTDYQVFARRSLAKFQFYSYRPVMLPQECATKAEEKNVSKHWWTYALKYAAAQAGRKKDHWTFMSEEKREAHHKDFLRLYKQISNPKNQLGFEVLQGQDKRVYENILMTVGEREVKEWLENDIRREQVEEELRKEQQKKQGYFGGWFKGSKDLDKEEKEEIENFVKDVFEKENEQEIDIPDHYSKIKLRFFQEKFDLMLSKRDVFSHQDKVIQICASQLEVHYYLKKLGKKIDLSLQSFSIDYADDKAKDFVSQKILFCNQQSSNFDKLLKICIEEHPESIPGLDSKIGLELGSVNLVYHKKMINTLVDIFAMDQINQGITDHIKTQTQKKIRQAQDIGENVVKNFLSDQPKLLITFSLQTPQILLPVNQKNIESSPCWVFHPGNLKVKGDTFTASNQEKNLYDSYSVSLTDMKMLYFQSTEPLLNNESNKDCYAIFQNFNIEIECELLKKVFVQLNVVDARAKINAHLNALQLNFTPGVLKDLKELMNIFVEENASYRLEEKKKILSKANKGGFLSIKENNKLFVYYAALYQNTLFLFLNPKKDLQAAREISLEGKEFEYKTINLEIKLKEDKKEVAQLHFDDIKEFDSWKANFISVVDQIKERKLIFGVEEEEKARQTMLSLESQENETTENSPEEDLEEKIIELDLNFEFENLIVNIEAEPIYKLCTSNLFLNMKKFKNKIMVNLELHNFALEAQSKGVIEHLITSNYEQSLTCDILKENYVQKQEKLIIISFTQQNSKEGAFQEAKISFGSVFFDIQPAKVQKLLSFILAENQKHQEVVQGDSILDLVHDNELTPQILEIYNNSENKLDDKKAERTEMRVILEIQAISVLLINELTDAPLASLIIKDSQIHVELKRGVFELQADFTDLVAYDLTNYPHTLSKRDIPAITPREIFGKQNTLEKQILIHVEFSSMDPQIYNIPDDFINSLAKVEIQGIIVSFHMQVIMRILSFLTDQLLPALQPQQKLSQTEGTTQGVDYLFKRQAYIAVNKPFWMKLDVEIKNIQCKLEINNRQFVRAYLQHLTLENERTLSSKRLIKCDNNLNPPIKGIWNDDYIIKIEELNCELVEEEKQQKLTQGLYLTLLVQMMAFDLEYKALLNPTKVSNHQQRYMQTKVTDITAKPQQECDCCVDGTMLVDVELQPFVMILGNREYCALMGVLANCVSKNDGLDTLFIKDYTRKEALKDPSSMYVNMRAHSVSLVTLDNTKKDIVKAKVLLENLTLKMLTHHSQHSVLRIKIQDLKGYHLIQKDNKFYEKGFIGDFLITDQFQTNDLQELKSRFIQKLIETKFESKIFGKEVRPKFALEMEDCEERIVNLEVQELQILAQTDVLLHLSKLTSMPQDTLNENVHDSPQKQQAQKQDSPKTMRITIDIRDNFFVLTDAYFKKCLVTKGDILLKVQLFPQQKREVYDILNFQTVTAKIQEQEKLSMSLPPGDLGIKEVASMKIQVKLSEFEIFIADFASIYDGRIKEVAKRQLVLPWSLELNVDQLQVEKINKQNPLPDLVTIFLIKGFINKIELKIANRDIDTVTSIMNYAIALMGDNNTKTEQKEKEKDLPNKEDLYSELTFFYVSFNIVDYILLNLVHEHQNMFAPTLMFKIKKMKLLCDAEETIKALLGFQVQMDYFNSDIFKWEPFLEKSTLQLEYRTESFEKGVQGKSYRVQSSEKEPLNINISIPLLKKLTFLTQTLDQIAEEKKRELAELTSSKILDNLLQLRAENMTSQKIAEKERTFVSPIRVANNTGYDLEITYYKKFITLADNNTPEMKNLKNDTMLVKDGEHRPLNIEENEADYNAYQESFTQSFSYKFLAFRVIHPDLQVKKISGLNLEQNFARKLHLSGKQKNLRNFSVVYNSENIDDLKEIEISSSMKITNKIAKTITLFINHPYKKYTLDIALGETKHIPFDYLSFLCEVKIGEESFIWKIKKLESLQLKESGYSTLAHSQDKNFNFIFKVFREKKNYHLTHLLALPGLAFKNLLPVPLLIKFVNNKREREFQLQRQEEVFFSDFDISTVVSYSVKIQGFEQSKHFPLIQNQHLVYDKQITLKDRNKRECIFNVVRLKHGFCHFNFALLCDLILVNETNFHYQYNATTDKKKIDIIRVAGTKPLKGEEQSFDDKIIFIGSDKRTLNLKVKDHPNFQQQDFSNDAIMQGLSSGVFQSLMAHQKDNRKFFLEVGYKTTLVTLDEGDFLTTKVIHLTPKTLLYNKTPHKIELKNQSFIRDSILKPEEKQPLYVYDYVNEKLKFLDIEVEVKNQKYFNMSPIDLNKAGSKLFALRGPSGPSLIIRVETLIENDYVVVSFLDRTTKNDIYLKNNSRFNMRVSQLERENQWSVVIPDQCQKEIAFADPYINSQFSIDLLDSFNEKITNFEIDMLKMQNIVYEVDRQKCGQSSQRQIPDQVQKLYFEISFTIENDSRRIDVVMGDEYSKKKNKELKKQRTKRKKNIEEKRQRSSRQNDYQNYQIEINKFGISLIASYNDIIVEPFFFYFDKITAIAITTAEQSEFQFAINYMNIDNNYCSLSKYPVFLTPQVPLKKSENHQCLNFHCVLNNNSSKNLYDFELIELDLKPLVLTTEYLLVSVLNDVKQQIDAVLNSVRKPAYLDSYFTSVGRMQENWEWQAQKFRESDSWIHCRHLRLAQIKLILTFGMNQVSDTQGEALGDSVGASMFVKTIGVTFVNVDETPVTLPNLELFAIFESLEGFQNIMMTHMKDQLYRNAAQIVGNLDIIGNPVSLFSNVAGGVQQFFGEPVEGFVKGPLEGVYGIAKGSTSLVKITAASAFNTVSKVTNSLASGLTSLSMDQEYLRQRNLDRAHKPLTVFDGVGRGFLSFGKGVYSGITGVFTKPVSEIRKSGASGFFKGLAKGFGGLITKPIGGVFDAVSLTADGIKNTVTFFDDKANGQKTRLPRVFYGSFRFFKSYNELDAKIMRALLTIEKKRFESDTFLEAIKVEREGKSLFYIVLTFEHFIILDHKLSSAKMYCEIKFISKLDCEQKSTLTINYLCNNKSLQFSITDKESKILKIIKSVNYSRYIYYTNATHL